MPASQQLGFAPAGAGDLGAEIRAEIRAHGPIPFVRFMQLALYHPLHGYYERGGGRTRIGRHGDFYTSASVGELFGRLLAHRLCAWLDRWAAGSLAVAEAGAHDGRLAADVLAGVRALRPELWDRFCYWIIEPSPARSRVQRATLQPFAGKVHWVAAVDDLRRSSPAGGGFHGVIFSNELLDAMPVHRLGWDAPGARWFEWGVGAHGRGFEWVRLTDPVSIDAACVAWRFLDALPAELRAVLPDGFTVEVGEAAEAWWRGALRAIDRGVLTTLDYGLEELDLLAPHRSGGTLRSYRNHQLVRDCLAAPGEQDLTASVNFTALRRAGEALGARTVESGSQAQFLTRCLDAARADRAWLAQWNAQATRQFQTLTHPDHLGRAFRVLAMAMGGESLSQQAPREGTRPTTRGR